MKNGVKEIIVTGGPCSGKTLGIEGNEDEGLEGLKQKLSGLGYRVFVAPEVATRVISGGVRDMAELAAKDPQKYLGVQTEILKIQLDDRGHLQTLANLFPNEPRLIIYDRGPKDGEAYLPEGYFENILKQLGLTVAEVSLSFDAVIHLVSAADGAEAYYNLDNSARFESLEAARLRDQRTLNAWTGHPHLTIIDNSTDFSGKMRRLLKAVLRVLGVPEPLEIERKFLVETVTPEKAISGFFKSSLIYQHYIDIPEKEKFRGVVGEARIRREVGEDDSSIYCLVQKKNISDKVRGENETRITPEDFNGLLKFRMRGVDSIIKRRCYFVYKHRYFMLDVFFHPYRVHREGLCLLETELIDENDEVDLPSFLKIPKEVTGDEEYTNFAIAQKR